MTWKAEKTDGWINPNIEIQKSQNWTNFSSSRKPSTFQKILSDNVGYGAAKNGAATSTPTSTSATLYRGKNFRLVNDFSMKSRGDNFRQSVREELRPSAKASLVTINEPSSFGGYATKWFPEADA